MQAFYFFKADPGSLQKSINHYQKAIHAKPESPIYHYNLALAYTKLSNDFEKAKQSYLNAIQFDPANDLYYNEYGVLLYEQGLYNEAIGQYQKAIELKKK